jgi:hypothetical protein
VKEKSGAEGGRGVDSGWERGMREMESEKRPEISLQLYRYIISSVGIWDRTWERHATHFVAPGLDPCSSHPLEFWRP